MLSGIPKLSLRSKIKTIQIIKEQARYGRGQLIDFFRREFASGVSCWTVAFPDTTCDQVFFFCSNVHPQKRTPDHKISRIATQIGHGKYNIFYSFEYRKHRRLWSIFAPGSFKCCIVQICPGTEWSVELSLILLGLCLVRLQVREFRVADVIFIKFYVWIIRVLIQM